MKNWRIDENPPENQPTRLVRQHKIHQSTTKNIPDRHQREPTVLKNKKRKKDGENPMETGNRQVDLGNKVVGQIELPTINVSPYIGRKARITTVTEHEGDYGYFVKVTTEPVAILPINDKNGNPIELSASKIFSLQTDNNGNIGWGENTKLGVFLKKMGASHYLDLHGKEVICQVTVQKETGKEFLTFA